MSRTQEPTWNYSELKRKSSDISENFDAIITDNKFRERFMSKSEMLLNISALTDFPYKGQASKRFDGGTCFRIASLTKQFTAVAVMQLGPGRKVFQLMIQSTNIFRHINTAKKSPLKTCLQ